MSTTALADVQLGAMLFTPGISFSTKDLGLKSTSNSQKAANTGRGKHPGIVFGRTRDGVILVGITKFGAATSLVGTVGPSSLSFWVPIAPKQMEPGMQHAPINLIETVGWIYVRRAFKLSGPAFKLLPTVQTLETVNMLRTALRMNPVGAATDMEEEEEGEEDKLEAEEKEEEAEADDQDAM